MKVSSQVTSSCCSVLWADQISSQVIIDSSRVLRLENSSNDRSYIVRTWSSPSLLLAPEGTVSPVTEGSRRSSETMISLKTVKKTATMKPPKISGVVGGRKSHVLGHHRRAGRPSKEAKEKLLLEMFTADTGLTSPPRDLLCRLFQPAIKKPRKATLIKRDLKEFEQTEPTLPFQRCRKRSFIDDVDVLPVKMVCRRAAEVVPKQQSMLGKRSCRHDEMEVDSEYTMRGKQACIIPPTTGFLASNKKIGDLTHRFKILLSLGGTLREVKGKSCFSFQHCNQARLRKCLPVYHCVRVEQWHDHNNTLTVNCSKATDIILCLCHVHGWLSVKGAIGNL